MKRSSLYLDAISLAGQTPVIHLVIPTDPEAIPVKYMLGFSRKSLVDRFEKQRPDLTELRDMPSSIYAELCDDIVDEFGSDAFDDLMCGPAALRNSLAELLKSYVDPCAIELAGYAITRVLVQNQEPSVAAAFQEVWKI